MRRATVSATGHERLDPHCTVSAMGVEGCSSGDRTRTCDPVINREARAPRGIGRQSGAAFHHVPKRARRGRGSAPVSATGNRRAVAITQVTP
jgi:hypothetical protein